MFTKTLMVSALAGAALACSVSTASARPADEVPPPPSSIAVSAADEYQDLRSPDAADAARGATVVQDLRAPDTRDAAAGYDPPVIQTVADDGSPSGFDVVSGALGAAAGIGLAILAVVLSGGLTGRLPRRHAART